MPAGREAREKEGVEDRKEETSKEIKEQQALYTQAKRQEGVLPDRAGLNRKRQRTGI